jgi:ATP-dependent Clp protease ATP-binding subunit ClpC
MFERFTDRARGAIIFAQESARDLGHPYVGTEHLLLALSDGDGIAAKALQQLRFDRSRFEHSLVDEVRQYLGVGELAGGPVQRGTMDLPFTPRLKQAIEAGLRESLSLGHNYIGTEHLILGLLGDESSIATKLLAEQNISERGVRDVVVRLLTELAAQRSATTTVKDPVDETGGQEPTAAARCPGCHEPLAANLGAEVMPSVGEVERLFVVAYCRICGHTLTVLPDD